MQTSPWMPALDARPAGMAAGVPAARVTARCSRPVVLAARLFPYGEAHPNRGRQAPAQPHGIAQTRQCAPAGSVPLHPPEQGVTRGKAAINRFRTDLRLVDTQELPQVPDQETATRGRGHGALRALRRAPAAQRKPRCERRIFLQRRAPATAPLKPCPFTQWQRCSRTPSSR